MAAEVIYLLKEQHIYVSSSIWVIAFPGIKWEKDLNYLPVESVGIALYREFKKNRSPWTIYSCVYFCMCFCVTVFYWERQLCLLLMQKNPSKYLEYLLIFIKVSKGWILTVIFIWASASLSEQTYPEFTYPSGLLHTAATFLKTCGKVFSIDHLAVEHCTDCVLNLRKLPCISDVFYAALETVHFLDDFCWFSQVAGVDLHTCNG